MYGRVLYLCHLQSGNIVSPLECPHIRSFVHPVRKPKTFFGKNNRLLFIFCTKVYNHKNTGQVQFRLMSTWLIRVKKNSLPFLWVVTSTGQVWFMVCVSILRREHPKAQPKVVLEKPRIEPATPGLQGIAPSLIHYTTTAMNNLIRISPVCHCAQDKNRDLNNHY